METIGYEKVYYWTEQREDHVLLRNVFTGELAFSVGYSREGGRCRSGCPMANSLHGFGRNALL